MKKVALIGGIGSGKSTVCGLFAAWGAGVVKLDEIGHEALTFPAVKEALRTAFGDAIFDEGRVVRSRLAAVAFDSIEHTRTLNAITHPAIMDECFRRVDDLGKSHEVVIVEVTSGDMVREAFSWADAVVAIAAPEDVRIARACERGMQTECDVRARIACQPSDEQRAAIADYVIDNGAGIEQTRRSVEAVWADLGA
ncbi:MAG: dephospho-CoA kinase [Slackia sp.]|nr:dephospho-CoA kinase [Slackia sp.]